MTVQSFPTVKESTGTALVVHDDRIRRLLEEIDLLLDRILVLIMESADRRAR